MRNVEIVVIWGGYGSLKVIGNVAIRYSTYFPIKFNGNYASIFYGFQVIASHLSKVANFNLPHLDLVALFGVTPFELY